MSDKVLISPSELSDLMIAEPVVLIDTRDPAIYAEAHIPVPSENLIRWIRSRKENRIMIETDGDLLQTFAQIYVGLLSFA